MTMRWHITVQGPFRKSWRPRKGTRAAWGDVLGFVLAIVRRRLRCGAVHLPHFDAAAAEVVHVAVETAAARLQAGALDLFGGSGYRAIDAAVAARVADRQGEGWADLLGSRASVRKALVAIVIAWLRIQFPILNTATAAAAVAVLTEFLGSRAE